MSVDKLVDSAQLNADLTSVANAIRTKGGTSASLDFPADFVSAIANIPSGGGSSYAEFSATMASTNATIVFDAGAYEIPAKYILFFKSGLLTGDGVNIIMRCGYHTNQTAIGMINQPGNNSQSRYFVWKANGGSDYYGTQVNGNYLTKSGSNLSLKISNSHLFLSGATYTVQIYELDSTFFG